ncbi:MAG TPA: class I SAM-dependent methyltransferase [Planctomycetota bacterium]|nr:class I SAM-dependent methyltransferase [Planctomycetota bacterium]
MESPASATLAVLGCGKCPAGRAPFLFSDGCVRCPSCGVAWPVGPHGAVNSLIDPAESVLREIDGMRQEHLALFPTRESFFFQKVEHVSRIEERIDASTRAGEAKNYYRSTELNFRYAFGKLGITGKERVLEIGAEHDLPFLKPFRERGCECYATNLYSCYEELRAPIAQVVLGDMNRLPWQNESFEIVVMSAASHHSPDLPGLMRELARVTKPGGRVLLLNDPTEGWLKHALDWCGLGSKKGGERHALVNENEYSAAAYRREAKANGFALQESFFSVYYDEKLRSGQVSGVRFAPLAKLVSWLWRIAPLRWLLLKTALYPGQLLIGLELNMILEKRR